MLIIESAANKRIKKVVELKEKAKARRENELFVVEGIRMFEETPRHLIDSVFVTQTFLDKFEDTEKIESCGGVIVSDDVFKKMSDTVSPQGILCLVKWPRYNIDEIISKENVFLLLLEDVQDPGNLGTIIRTAEGAGIDGIIMSKGCADVFSPKVIRSTMGAIYRMPFVTVDDIPAMEDKLRNQGVKVLAAALGHDTWYTVQDYSGKCAILIGNEGNGLTENAINQASAIVTIPMEGKLESLNAAVSAAILMYEAKRQRG